MAQKTRKSMILVKSESVYRTDPTPDTTADALVVYDLELTPETDGNERASQGVSLGMEKEIGGARRYKVKFRTPLVGGGAAGTPPKGIHALNKACAMSYTNTPATSDVYAMASASHGSCAIYAHIDGVLHKLLGCRGTKEIEGVAGELVYHTFEMFAVWAEPVDTSFPTTWVPNPTVPVAFKNVTATLDGYEMILRKFTLKFNNQVTERKDANETHGIAGYEIVDRNLEAEITIEAIPLATKDYWAKLAADTLMALSIAIGSAAGNISTLAAPYVRLRQIPYSDEDGLYVHPLPVQLAKTVSGNNEYTESYT